MSATMQAPAPYKDAPITEGHPIYTLDNKRLGHVKEIGETHFKVDARFRKDFWLSRAQVAYVDEHCVGMLFRSDEAELYKLPEASDDGFQRRFERDRPIPGEDITDSNFRARFPLS